MTGFPGLNSDGTDSPWRSRGAFKPTAPSNALVNNLPISTDCIRGPYVEIAPGDSFIVAEPFDYTGLSNGSFSAKVGDRLVYNGGDITTRAAWLGVYEAFKYAGQRIAVIAQLDPAFLN